jgi:hypothetical protein
LNSTFGHSDDIYNEAIVNNSNNHPEVTQVSEPNNNESKEQNNYNNLNSQDGNYEDYTLKNINEILKHSDDLNPGEKERLEEMREARIKKIMDTRGKEIINEYNQNNPQPISNYKSQSQTIINNNTIQQTNEKEKNQAKPQEQFISILK